MVSPECRVPRSSLFPGGDERLKGTSATMSARCWPRRAWALEAAAGQGEVAGPEALDRVSELERAEAALRAYGSANGRGVDE